MRSRVSFGLSNKGAIDSRIDNNLNEATLQHTLRVRPKEMQKSTTFSVSNATAAYNIDSTVATDADLYAVLYVRNNTDDVPLLQAVETDWNNAQRDTSVSSNLGEPHKWLHIEDDLILFEQIPDSTSRTIAVRYLRRPATMTSSVDFPLLEEHERPVEQLAKALTWLDLGNTEKARAAFESYEMLVNGRQQPEQTEDEHSHFQLMPVDNLYEAD